MSLLKIENLSVSTEDKKILKGVDININKGEVHVIMGPNGSGKSTLAAAIVGNPIFKVDNGKIFFKGKDLQNYTVDERAREGIFLSFQIPEEIPGLQLNEFLHTAKQAVTGEKIPLFRFHKKMLKEMEKLNMNPSYADRALNVGFSGGEKKKSEILQLAMLEPQLAILDETDSGLDVDSTKIVFEGVQKIKQDNKDMGVLIITHYSKVLDYLHADYVHVLIDGKIAKSGGYELVEHVDKYGYKQIIEELREKR